MASASNWILLLVAPAIAMLVPSAACNDRTGELPRGQLAMNGLIRGRSLLHDPVAERQASLEVPRLTDVIQRQGASSYLHSSCNAWVSAAREDGTFSSVQEAIDALSGGSSRLDVEPVLICIKPGVYEERIHVKKGQNGVTLLGTGKEITVTGSSSGSVTGDPFYAATLIVEGHNFTARDITIQNEEETIGDPSPAIAVIGRHSTWSGVRLAGWSNTVGLFTSSHMFINCQISGADDIVWGFGRGAFLDTTIVVRTSEMHENYVGHIATLGTDWASKGVTAGAVFQNCKLTGEGRAYLGRPYRPITTVVYINCHMGPAVIAEGWSDWNQYSILGNAIFAEYGSYGPGAQPGARQLGSFVADGDSVPQPYTIDGFL